MVAIEIDLGVDRMAGAPTERERERERERAPKTSSCYVQVVVGRVLGLFLQSCFSLLYVFVPRGWNQEQ